MSHIDDVIAKCAEALDTKDGDLALDVLRNVPCAYEPELPHIYDSLNFYSNMAQWEGTSRSDLFGDVSKVRSILVTLKEKREHDMRIAELNASAISVQANSMSTSESNVSINITLEQVMEHIDGISDSALSENEKAELKSLMLEVDASKRKGKDRLLKATKEVVGWVCDKGIESLPTVLNYVAQAAQSMM